MNNRKRPISALAWIIFLMVPLATVLVGCEILDHTLTFVTNSHDRAKPIATAESPVIGGIPQGIVIRGTNPDNPVLLYVHGGPGRPVYPVLHNKEPWRQLEDLFTIAYWDQRGAGISNPTNLDTSTLNLDSLVKDTAEVADFLKDRLVRRILCSIIV